MPFAMHRLPRPSLQYLRSLAKDVASLSRLLTRERDRLPEGYLRQKRFRDAYISYFLPANLEKIHLPLRELSLHPARFFAKDRIRVLDVGTGPGTALLGVMDFFAGQEPSPRLDLTALDPVRENLAHARVLAGERLAGYAAAGTLMTINADAVRAASLKERFDLVLLSNVVNELYAGQDDRTEKRAGIAAGIIGLLEDAGSCIIIEPALREASRDLLMVRELLRGMGFLPYSPCLTGAGCGAIANARDWCHEDIPWEPPSLVRDIDLLTGLRKESLKFSYLVVRKDGLSLADICGGAYRAVSEPIVTKGKTELYLCGPGGRKQAMRLDRDRSGANDAFGRVERGTIVRVRGLVDEEKRSCVTRETEVDILFPPGGKSHTSYHRAG